MIDNDADNIYDEDDESRFESSSRTMHSLMHSSSSGKPSIRELDMDGVFCGQIFPQHISASGGIKLQITTRSDQYRIQVVAQSLKDPAHNGNYKVLAKSQIDMVIDRSRLSDDDSDTSNFSILSRK